MLSLVRRSRLSIVAAVVALLTGLPMSALPLLHGLSEDDTCSRSGVEHGAAAHQMRAGTDAADAPHCSICHLWQSAGRFSSPSLPSTLIPFVDAGLVAATPAVQPTLTSTASRPA